MQTEDPLLSRKEKKSGLDEELIELRLENSSLRDQLSKTEIELHQTQILLASVREDRDKLRSKVSFLHSSIK